MEKIKDNKIHIALACDAVYAPYAMVVMVSILQNTGQAASVVFHIITEALPEALVQQMQALAASYGSSLFIHIAQELPSHVYTNGHLSAAAYYRLLLGSLLPDSITRVIYLDCDLLVLGDISVLWQYDLQSKTMGAVPDYGILASKRSMVEKQKTLFLRRGDSYFNSGVLLINLQQWRNKSYEEKVLAEARTGRYRHNDQDILNKVLYGDWQSLPLEWNVIPPLFLLGFKIVTNYKLRKMVRALGKPCILHWAGRKKPWQYSKTKGFNQLYYVYAEQVVTGTGLCMPAKVQLSWHKRLEGKLAGYFYSKRNT